MVKRDGLKRDAEEDHGKESGFRESAHDTRFVSHSSIESVPALDDRRPAHVPRRWFFSYGKLRSVDEQRVPGELRSVPHSILRARAGLPVGKLITPSCCRPSGRPSRCDTF